MAKSRKGLVVAAVAFANTPQGRQLIQQAKEYLSRPETRQKGLELLALVRTRARARIASRSAARSAAPSPPYRVVRGPPRRAS